MSKILWNTYVALRERGNPLVLEGEETENKNDKFLFIFYVRGEPREPPVLGAWDLGF